MKKKGRGKSKISSVAELKLVFHKWKKQLLYVDKAIYIFVILSLGFLPIDFLMIGVYLFLFPYLFLTDRKPAIYHLLVSSLIALVWMLIANNQYGYNREIISLFGLSTFPLFAWATGLFATYLFYSHWENKVINRSWFSKLLLFTLIYIPVLVIFETVSYHLFGIQDLATAMYPGLPFINAFHAPPWMQISYFLMGPIYFIVCELFGLENPHHLKTKK